MKDPKTTRPGTMIAPQKFLEYSNIYRTRLDNLSARILRKIRNNPSLLISKNGTGSFSSLKSKYSKKNDHLKINHIFEVNDSPSIVLGSLHRHLKCRQDILARFSDNLQIQFKPSELNFVSNSDDKLYFEDGNQRIPIEIHPDLLEKNTNKIFDVYPGAVLGIVCKNSSPLEEKVTIIDYILPGCLQQSNSLQSIIECNSISNKILMVSNLCFESHTGEIISHKMSIIECLRQMIAKNISSGNFLDGVTQLLIIGSNIGKKDIQNLDLNKENIASDFMPNSIREFEDFLIDICENCDFYINVVSGWDDPVSLFYPQSAFPNLIFSKLLNKFPRRIKFCTNPIQNLSLVDNQSEINFLVSDGSNLKSIKNLLYDNTKLQSDQQKYSHSFTDIEIMQNLIKHGHFLPLTPDIIPCEPEMESDDPLIIKEQPHFFISGGSQSLTHGIIQEFNTEEGTTYLISLPDFSKNPCLTVLNPLLGTLENLNISYS